MKDDDIYIMFYCLKSMEFCQKASKTMAPIPTQSETMQETYQSLSRIFSGFAEDFENIAKIAGLELDLTSPKGEIVLKKINSLTDLNKVQRKKCLKEISTLLS